LGANEGRGRKKEAKGPRGVRKGPSRKRTPQVEHQSMLVNLGKGDKWRGEGRGREDPCGLGTGTEDRSSTLGDHQETVRGKTGRRQSKRGKPDLKSGAIDGKWAPNARAAYKGMLQIKRVAR